MPNHISRGLLLLILLWRCATPEIYPQSGIVPPTRIPGGGYRIAGTVVSKADGHPLARARIFVTNVKDQKSVQSMVTADDGKFEFSGLPAAKFSLTGVKRGYIGSAYEQHGQFSTAIVTGAGIDTEALLLRLPPAALIRGKVLDEAGEPVRNARITAYYDDHSLGVSHIHAAHTAQTNDQGSYEITPLTPGTYFLSAQAEPWYAVHPISPSEGQPAPTSVDRSLDVAYPLTYFADATDAESAVPIPIQGGERLQADFHLNPVPALRLVFQVPETGERGYNFPQLQQPAFDGYTFVNGVSRVISPGLLEISGVPAGRYDLRIWREGSGLQMNGLDINTNGQEIDTTSSEPLSTIKVAVKVPEEATLPPQLGVGLRSGRRMLSAWQQIDAKGQATFLQIPSGRYQLLVGNPGKPHFIAHASADGAEISGHTLTVTPGSSPSVSLTLTGTTGEIHGVVKRAGKPFAGAMVVLVPKGTDPEVDLFRRDQSDLDGTFSLQAVIPGSYTITAIENGWDLDWSQPGTIAAYFKHGQTIDVEADRVIELKEAVELQSK